MKRFLLRLTFIISKISLLLTSFVVGISVLLLWQEIFPPKVTLCQLAQNPGLYRYRRVQVEANARSIYGAVFIADESCQSAEASAGVWLVEGSEPKLEVQPLYRESNTEIYKARILVTGRFDPEATPGCFAPRYAIHAKNVELKSAITTEPMRRRQE